MGKRERDSEEEVLVGSGHRAHVCTKDKTRSGDHARDPVAQVGAHVVAFLTLLNGPRRRRSDVYAFGLTFPEVVEVPGWLDAATMRMRERFLMSVGAVG